MSIDLKGVTFSILLAVLGVGLVLIGAAQKFSITGTAIEVADMRFRVALVVLGLILLVGAAYSEFRRREAGETAQAETKSPQMSNAGSEQAQTRSTTKSFLLTLDDEEVGSFVRSVDGAVRLQILARTVVNLVGQHGHSLASLAKTGCEIQILIVDPASESARHVYGSNYSSYLRNAQTALSHLANLQQRCGDRIRVRFYTYVPTLSIMNVERREAAESFVQVQMYFVHGAIGRDRPVFRVYRTDPWYDIFREEFDSIWKAFPDIDAASAAAKLSEGYATH